MLPMLSNPIARFQAALLLFVAATVFAQSMGLVPFIVSFGLLFGLSAASAARLAQSERRAGGYLLAAFSAFSATAMAARLLVRADPIASFLVLPVLTLVFFAAYLVLKWFVLAGKVECTVLGYSNGLAIVQTQPSLSSGLPAGRHVVESRPVKAGRRAVLVLSTGLLGADRPLRLVFHGR